MYRRTACQLSNALFKRPFSSVPRPTNTYRSTLLSTTSRFYSEPVAEENSTFANALSEDFKAGLIEQKQIQEDMFIGEVIDFDEMTTQWQQRGGDLVAKQKLNFYKVIPDIFEESALDSMNINLKVAFDKFSISNGRIVTPTMANAAASITFESEKGKTYSLIMTSPDDNVFNEFRRESLRLLVTNIKGTGKPIKVNECGKAKTLREYIPPTPAEGTGILRYVYILFEHKTQKPVVWEDSLEKSFDFSTAEFTKDNKLKVKGVNMFQSYTDENTPLFYKKYYGITMPKYLHEKEPIVNYSKRTRINRKARYDWVR